MIGRWTELYCCCCGKNDTSQKKKLQNTIRYKINSVKTILLIPVDSLSSTPIENVMQAPLGDKTGLEIGLEAKSSK